MQMPFNWTVLKIDHYCGDFERKMRKLVMIPTKLSLDKNLFTSNARAGCKMTEKFFILYEDAGAHLKYDLISLPALNSFTLISCSAPLCLSFRNFRNCLTFNLVKFGFISSIFTRFVAACNKNTRNNWFSAIDFVQWTKIICKITLSLHVLFSSSKVAKLLY